MVNSFFKKRGYKLRQAAPENWSGFFIGNAGGQGWLNRKYCCGMMGTTVLLIPATDMGVQAGVARFVVEYNW